MMTFLLAVCGKCSETFVPADDTDLEHLETTRGVECLGMGWHADPWAPYKRLDPQPDCADLGPFIVIEEDTLTGDTEYVTQYDTLPPALIDAQASNRSSSPKEPGTTRKPRYYVERKDG